ncbi:hypothetical protein SPFM20_00173 [Salmonella phage SPFM20]|nr:hypothetical protein SPFM1_00182 [Salmonella phage SPFM1]VFR14835.1 hypothetical protein SPFM20_00173 [Salmonella phage SPFM20]
MWCVANTTNEFMLFHPEVDASEIREGSILVANFDRMEEGQYVVVDNDENRDLPKREVTLSVDAEPITVGTYVKQPT